MTFSTSCALQYSVSGNVKLEGANQVVFGVLSDWDIYVPKTGATQGTHSLKKILFYFLIIIYILKVYNMMIWYIPIHRETITKVRLINPFISSNSCHFVCVCGEST